MDMWFPIIYSFLVLGAVGLFLMMPRTDAGAAGKIGGLIGAVSLIGLMVALLGRNSQSLGGDYVWFTLFASVAITSAILMIIQKRAIYSALFFVLTLLASAGLILLQQATFLAIALVIVYAGAVLVVYVFVLMLSQQEAAKWHDQQARTPFLAVVIGFILIGSLLQIILGSGPSDMTGLNPEALTGSGTALAIGKELFNHQVVALQVGGLILLIAAVGAIAIVKHAQKKQG